MQTPPLWKASVTLTKEEAQNVSAAFELTYPAPQAVLINEEPFKDEATVEALFDRIPDGDLLDKLAGKPVYVALLPDVDWIKLSQQGLPPVRAGRFFVYGAYDAGKVPEGVVPLCIDAGIAFGTGHHETTALCLSVLSDLAKVRRYNNMLDLGCGTGLIGIGAAKLWKKHILAADISPDAVLVTRDNAIINGVGPLVTAVESNGMRNPVITQTGSFDLIIANILSGPLTRLAKEIACGVMPGGTLVLSGLLEWQEIEVLSFYRAQGMVLRQIRREHHWSALVLERPHFAK